MAKVRIVGWLILALLMVSLFSTFRSVENSRTAATTMFAGESLEESDPPDSLSSTSTYFRLRRDLRRCVSPLCGGYFVTAVNRSSTRCFDGRYSPQCYVAEIDWNGQTSVEENLALVRGTMSSKDFGRFKRFGVLRVTESWQAANDHNPQGRFYRVKDRGIRCIAAPCITHHAAQLNSSLSSNIAGVDLTVAGASDSAIQEANAAMGQKVGIIVAGATATVRGPAGRAKTIKATQFYLKTKSDAALKPCIKTGCSNQICADETVVTTCEYSPKYACYQKATCERQADGHCGFTKTKELMSCLNRF